MSNNDIKSRGSFAWSIAEFLRSDFKQSEYGKVILYANAIEEMLGA